MDKQVAETEEEGQLIFGKVAKVSQLVNKEESMESMVNKEF